MLLILVAASAARADGMEGMLEVGEGQVFVLQEGQAPELVTRRRQIVVGDVITTSPGATGRILVDEEAVPLSGLSRYRMTPDGLESKVSGSLAASPPAHAGRGKHGKHFHKGSAPAAPVEFRAHITLIAGGARIQPPGWPRPTDVARRASVKSGTRLFVRDGSLVEIAFPTGGWMKIIGAAELTIDKHGLYMDEVFALVKDLDGMKLYFPMVEVDPGDFLVSFEKDNALTIRSLEGVIPVRVQGGERDVLLPPGRQIHFDARPVPPITATIDIRKSLLEFQQAFDAVTKPKEDRFASRPEEKARETEAMPEDAAPAVPRIEPDKRDRLSLRDRVRAGESFEKRWAYFLAREEKIHEATYEVLAESYAHKGDNEVAAFDLAKARRRVDVSRLALEHEDLRHGFHGRMVPFMTRVHREQAVRQMRERLLEQPLEVQTRGGIVAAQQLATTFEARADAVTDEIRAREITGLSDADRSALERQREDLMIQEQLALDRIQELVRIQEEPRLLPDDLY